MQESDKAFQNRLSHLRRKHKAMANGYSAHLQADGLIVVRPKRPRRRYPVRAVLLIFLGFFAFKAFMLSSLGEITYNERVAKLGNGTAIEQGGAWIMQVDPVTQFLAGFMQPLT